MVCVGRHGDQRAPFARSQRRIPCEVCAGALSSVSERPTHVDQNVHSVTAPVTCAVRRQPEAGRGSAQLFVAVAPIRLDLRTSGRDL